MVKGNRSLFGAVVLAFAASTAAFSADDRPNIVIILADDMGYSDVGSFGSEIQTPSIDALAQEGVRFTQFYTHASCSPTRSMLLSGVDTHLNGLGNMDEWTAPNRSQHYTLRSSRERGGAPAHGADLG